MIIEVVGKEIEKIKGDFESYLNGLNMVGEISYSQYSELYDEGTKQIQRAYELGKSELEKENAELEQKLEQTEKDLADYQFNYPTIKELQKENAEYKEVFGDCSTCKRTCDMGCCCDPRTKNNYLVDKVKVIAERQKLLKENAELKKTYRKQRNKRIDELQKKNAELRNTETMLKVLKDRGVIKSWYYNGSYHVGNELPR